MAQIYHVLNVYYTQKYYVVDEEFPYICFAAKHSLSGPFALLCRSLGFSTAICKQTHIAMRHFSLIKLPKPVLKQRATTVSIERTYFSFYVKARGNLKQALNDVKNEVTDQIRAHTTKNKMVSNGVKIAKFGNRLLLYNNNLDRNISGRTY